MTVVINASATPTWNTSGGSTTLTLTPALNDLLVVIAGSSGLAGGTTAVTDNNSSGTYTQVDVDRTGFSTTGVLTAWVRTALIGSAVSTIVTAAQVGSSGGGLMVIRVAGMGPNLLGANAVRSSGGQSTVASGTPAPQLSLIPLALNPIITAVGSGTNGGGTAVRTGYTDIAISGYNTPATGLDICYRESGENTDIITWGGAAPSQFASIAIELNTQEVKAPVIDFPGPANLMERLGARWKRRPKSGLYLPEFA